MSRRGFSKPPAGNHIFPFLAVLICTMGALVTLLVVISGRARQTAVARAIEEASDQFERDAADQREDLAWRIEQLRAARDRNEQTLAEKRRQLSHIEDHLRRLKSEIDQLRDQQIDDRGLRSASAPTADSAELTSLKRELRLAERELAIAEEEARGRSPKYAVVPYQGPNQTRRRPIYIECRADRVVLQPEGIELLDADFEGPMGPGNPLAATLRTVCELVGNEISSDDGVSEPYPLLLVRPDGIPAYYAARAALNSWGSEFGYEFIEADWELDFPDVDNRAKELGESTLAEARERQRRLIAAAPKEYVKPNRALFTANGRGGLRQIAGPRASATGAAGTNREESDAAKSQGGGELNAAFAGGAGGLSPAHRGGASGRGLSGRNDLRGDGAPMANGERFHGERFPGGGTNGDGGHSNSESGAGRIAAADQRADEFGKFPSGGGTSESPSFIGRRSNRSSGDAGGVSTPFAPTSSGAPSSPREHVGAPSENMIGAGEAGSGSQSDSGAAGALRSGSHSGADGGRETQGKRRYTAGATSGITSLAGTRGRGWGLPEAGAESSPVARPVRVLCEKDRLIVIADDSAAQQKTIALADATEDSVDEFVASVWQAMKSWGTAGRGLYWKPVLVFDVTPDARQRYSELQSLLSESGLEVRERQTQAATAPRPARR